MPTKKLRKEIHRDILKTIRFSKEEILEIDNIIKDKNIKFTEFVRARILNYKLKSSVNNELNFQLQKIGNNLNQIAKKINYDSSIKNEVELLETLNQMTNILNELKNDR